MPSEPRNCTHVACYQTSCIFCTSCTAMEQTPPHRHCTARTSTLKHLLAACSNRCTMHFVPVFVGFQGTVSSWHSMSLAWYSYEYVITLIGCCLCLPRGRINGWNAATGVMDFQFTAVDIMLLGKKVQLPFHFWWLKNSRAGTALSRSVCQTMSEV